jgi:predicted ATPase
VRSNGDGTTRVLKSLKLGVYEDRFAAIERAFCRCVPEVSKLSFFQVEQVKWAIQVSEVGLPDPVPLSQLSDGSRLILAILTIIYQPNPPEVILLEDIDRGIHPRLYEQLVRQMRQITREHGVQIIATTHSPYLLDEFQDEPESVVLVEKVNGESRLSNLDDRLKEVFGNDGAPETPLGELWFSGAVGGVPKRKSPSLTKP